MNAISVAVVRGEIVEAVHSVHAVATDGRSFGDASLTCFLRSSSKPIQAIPLVEAYDDLAEEEIAIACASHQAEPAQLAAVRMLLDRAGATPDDLENGVQEGRPQGKVGHNCSGKHAGMLAACRANGWPFRGYRLPEHPLQVRIRELIGGDEGIAVDGCGVPTFALSLSQMSLMLTRTPERIAEAMRARPELVGGEGADDTALMRARPGWIAKRGAEGLFCAAGPDGLGLALKVEDGASRALRPVLGFLLGVESFQRVPVKNSRDEVVGELRIAPG